MKSPTSKSWLLPLCLLVGLAAASFAAWTWKQAARPGRVHYERGLDYAAANRLPQAEQEWLAGVHEDPDFPDNHAQLGDLYSALGRPGEAASHYLVAARLTPKDVSLFLRLMRADEAAGDTEAALDAAGNAAALRPEDEEAQGAYGILAAKMNQPTRALPPLKRAHALAPDNADVLIYLVRVELQLRDAAGAERDLTPFVQRHPDSAEACFLMAQRLEQKTLTRGTLAAALDYARRAQAGAPSNEQACVLLGQLYLQAKAPLKALPLFQQARRTSPSAQDVLHGLITCGTQLHMTDLAARAAADLNAAVSRHTQIALLQDRLHLHPEDTAAALNAAHLEELDQNLPMARTYYGQAVHHAPQDPAAQAALGGFLRRTQRHSGPRNTP